MVSPSLVERLKSGARKPLCGAEVSAADAWLGSTLLNHIQIALATSSVIEKYVQYLKINVFIDISCHSVGHSVGHSVVNQ